MTGMGKAVYRGEDFSVEAELKSVNNRYLVIKSRIPDSLVKHEQRLNDCVRGRIGRGAVDLFVKFKKDGAKPSTRVNQEVLEGYIREVKRTLRREKLEGEALVPELLLPLPGVVEYEEDTFKITGKVLDLVEGCVIQAVERLVKMRTVEGRRLIQVIRKRIRGFRKDLRAIRSLADRTRKERTGKLKARIEEVLEGQVLTPQDPSLQREVAILVDRSDVSEELDRLDSHIDQFEKIIAADGEMGRALDFLIQEMGREVNTLGAKACSADVSHYVVRMKAELEKVREQVQNIE